MADDGPWEPEPFIPDEDDVLRQVLVMQMPKSDGRRIPNESNFMPNPDGLSVNWEKYCTVDNSYVVIGLSHNAKKNFCDITGFKILRLNVGFLRNIRGIEEVLHTPKFTSNPPPIGSPNNKSHSSVIYPDTNTRIRVQLVEWVKNNNEKCICPQPDFIKLRTIIEELKNRA